MAAFRRKIYTKMLDWKDRYSNKYALLIEGARRVGKTTIVEEFAKKKYESYLLIDFTTATDETKQWFKDYSDDLDTLFRQLQFRYSTALKKERASSYSMRYRHSHPPDSSSSTLSRMDVTATLRQVLSYRLNRT